MSYNLVEAGKAVGLGKTAILKAIRSGRISANKDELGGWCIEPAELHRVYQPVAKGTSDNRENRDGELAELRGRLTDMQDTVADLRRRLDESERERRAKDEKLTALLSDSRSSSSAPDSAVRRRRWWPWLK